MVNRNPKSLTAIPNSFNTADYYMMPQILDIVFYKSVLSNPRPILFFPFHLLKASHLPKTVLPLLGQK